MFMGAQIEGRHRLADFGCIHASLYARIIITPTLVVMCKLFSLTRLKAATKASFSDIFVPTHNAVSVSSSSFAGYVCFAG